jgi:predicted metalloprotease
MRAGGGAGGVLLLLRFLPMMLRSKVGRIVLVLGVLVFFGARLLGIDLLQVVDGGAPTASRSAQECTPQEQELAEFVGGVLADTEDTWNAIFAASGQRYQEPRLVLFSNRVASACGTASSAVGPFYCPGDNQVYLDLVFFRDLKQQLGAPGDFAQAYVIAHEVGHHVQNLMGISQKVRAAGAGKNPRQVNDLSVRQELQADCFAGVWGHNANNQQLLDEGDLQEALTAAAAIGDDRLQHRAGQDVVPDSFTHGTSEQRMTWFKRGFDSGDVGQCDSFSARL